MNYNKINEKYIIVATLDYYGQEVLYCRDKNNSDYAFFVLDNNKKYTYANKQDCINLFDMYGMKLRECFNLIISNEIKGKEKQNLMYIIGTSNDIMKRFLQKLEPECSKTIQHRLNHLIVEDLSNLRDGDTVRLNGCFHLAKNTIFINTYQGFSLTNLSVFIHESLHAASFTNNPKNSTGINKNEIVGCNYDNVFCVTSGVSINEGLTDYLTHEIICDYLKEKNVDIYEEYKLLIPSFSYSIQENVIKNIFKYCDNKKILDSYFTNNQDLFIETLKNEFKLPNDNEIRKIIYALDGYLTLKENHSSSYGAYFSFLTSTYNSLYNIITNKLKAEAKTDDVQYKFEDLIEKPSVSINQELVNNVFSECSSYSNFLKQSNILEHEHNNSNAINEIINYFNETEYCLLTENQKSWELFSHIFSHGSFVPKKYSTIKIPTKKEVASKILRDRKIMAKDENNRYEILSNLYLTRKLYDFNIVDCFDLADFAKALQSNESFFVNALINVPQNVFMCFKYFDKSLITSNVIIEKIVENISKNNNSKKEKLIKDLYFAYNKEDRTKISFYGNFKQLINTYMEDATSKQNLISIIDKDVEESIHENSSYKNT